MKHIRSALEELAPDIAFAYEEDGTVNLLGKILCGTNTALGILPLCSANGLATEVVSKHRVMSRYIPLNNCRLWLMTPSYYKLTQKRLAPFRS